MQAAVRSDVGKVREVNEDYTYVSEQYQNGIILAIVADGMGGHLAGEVASKTAVQTVYEYLDPLLKDALTMEQYADALESAIYKANDRIYEQSLNNEDYKGMGTTIDAAILSPNWFIIGHIGDSRAYLIENEIRQLTLDHSLVNELLKNGQITEQEAISHPQRNILTRALGTDREVKIDIISEKWEKGQTLIFCSDGLTNHVSDQTILEVVQGEKSLEETIDHLLYLANNAGGNDNISAIIITNGN